MTLRVGIDVGGTFTDLVCAREGAPPVAAKVPTTPADPSLGVIEGLRALAAAQHTGLGAFVPGISTIVHGTTVTTNTVLTRRGARVGLLTTEGLRDALEMRRGIRERQYDNRFPNVVPLVPRRLRRPVRGRLDARGAEVEPLVLDDVRAAARLLATEAVTAVAICFMNSFADPAHEHAAAEIVRGELRGAFVSVSSEVLPTIRFYDRLSTTVLDAYVGPALGSYLHSLADRLAAIGFGGVLLVMQSSGGMAPAEVVRRRPASTLLSGPAAGPRAGFEVVAAHGARSAVVVDMGGTSFDASLVRDGRVELRAAGEIDRLRVALPMLDIATIGAGGGSVAWIDAGGLLRVGPASAGADPGPACYRRGGERATVTDADVVLGLLDPDWFAGGTMPLDAGAARRAVETDVARPLGLGVEEAAAGIRRVVCSNMAHGVREITVRRGVDVRELPLVVAGGAGGLFACAIARELEVATVVFPRMASVLCAAGMLSCDLQHDFVRSLVGPLAGIDPEALPRLVRELVAAGEAMLDAERVPADARRHEVALDLRYLRQYHEVTVPVALAAIEGGDRAAVERAFHAEHDRLYGYQLSEQGTGLELINVRVRSLGRAPRPRAEPLAAGPPDPAEARKGTRRAFVLERGRREDVAVFDGLRVRAGNRIAGPALVERADTTLYLTPGWTATVDPRGTCLLGWQP